MKNAGKITVCGFLCVVAMMSSCVQGDLYVFYDEDISSIIQTKKTKEDINSGTIRVPGATPSDNPPCCPYYTLNCILNYVLGFSPDTAIVSNVCRRVNFGGIYSLKDAVTGVVAEYCSGLDFDIYLFSIDPVNSQTTYSEWDVVKTYKYKTKVEEWPDMGHVFVVESNCSISTSDFQNVGLPNGYVMYEGPALSSKSDPGSIKYHKDWIERRVSGTDIKALKEDVQNALNR